VEVENRESVAIAETHRAPSNIRWHCAFPDLNRRIHPPSVIRPSESGPAFVSAWSASGHQRLPGHFSVALFDDLEDIEVTLMSCSGRCCVARARSRQAHARSSVRERAACTRLSTFHSGFRNGAAWHGATHRNAMFWYTTAFAVKFRSTDGDGVICAHILIIHKSVGSGASTKKPRSLKYGVQDLNENLPPLPSLPARPDRFALGIRCQRDLCAL